MAMIAGTSDWTHQEDDFLRTHWQTTSLDELAQALSRPYGGVRGRGRKLGLGPALGAQPRWSDAEEATLRELFPLMSIEDLADQLGKPVKAVGLKCNRLGLKKRASRVEWTSEQLELLHTHVAELPLGELAQLIGLPVSLVESKAARLGLRRTKTSQAEPVELYDQRAFTPEEDNYIRQWYSTQFNTAIGQALNRPETSIAHRLKLLGLKRTKAQVAQIRQVNDTEVLNEYLASHYPAKSVQQIGQELGVSVKTVYWRARALGLIEANQPVRYWTPADDRWLWENRLAKSLSELATALDRSKTMIEHRLRLLSAVNQDGGEFVPIVSKRRTLATLSEEQKQYLIQNWERLSTDELVDQLQLAPKTVLQYARRLGLDKDAKKEGNRLAGADLSDRFILSILTRSAEQKKLMAEHPNLLHLKRLQLVLNRKIKHHGS
jgi:DNA-binding CsgD family transcriptional regulator